MSDLVENPEDRFSHDPAHLVFLVNFCCSCQIIFVCIDIVSCDLLHDVETELGLPGTCMYTTNSIGKSCLE